MVDENTVEGTARNIGGKIQEAVGDLAGDASTQIRGKINQTAGAAQTAIGGAADETRDLALQLGNEIRERPLMWTGIAVSIGFAIGCLSRR